MSWFWGSSKGEKDSTGNLDPALRDFLDKETARQQAELRNTAKPPSATAPTTAQPPKEYRRQLGLDTPGIHHTDPPRSPAVPDAPASPEKSQFQDGRYANLWKTYRSPEELAATTETDQDRLTAITRNFKDRKAAIGRAAIENCAFEQLAQQECWTSGSWSKLATGCSAESKSFNRCYNMQARFLKALGYLSAPRSDEAEDRIQAHADKLYQDMLKRETAMKEALARGEEPRPTKPLITAEETMKALGEDSAWAKMRADSVARGDELALSANFTKEQQIKITDSMKDMTDEEKSIELQLLAAELRVKKDLKQQFADYYEQERIERRQRREEGKETIGDKIKRYGGWQT